ncbi:helix-turn-helix transcriptional regulator [Eubacterium sp.]|uniref:helix-turn-helix transcriptional regulator n=1 Tax=Eubacterium sp. TaxID=142586 RepID=UPI0035218F6D
METIGNNIKLIRKKIGLTQEELALSIGVTPQAVSRWENGTGMPDILLIKENIGLRLYVKFLENILLELESWIILKYCQ